MLLSSCPSPFSGFFDEDEQTQELRDPTQEEINDLVSRTILFYEDLFLQEYGGHFLEFELQGT